MRIGLPIKEFPAVVFPLSVALNYPGEDDAERLRNFIIDAYTNYGTVWVLLGGDGYYQGSTNYIVPFRKGWARDNLNLDLVSHIPPSDLYFSDMNGKWDVDKDNRWGEPTEDSVDVYPEVFVGRILTSSPKETRNWVDKIIYYEQDGSTNLDLFRYTTWNYDSINGTEPEFWLYPWPETRAKFPSYYTQNNCKRQNANVVIDNLNLGHGIYGIYQHGWPNKFQTWANYVWAYAEDDGLNHLTNKGRYYVVYSISCYNAAYDTFTPPNQWTFPTDTTIADAFTDSYDSIGAVAFLGNTRLGAKFSSRQLHDKFLGLLFRTDDDVHIGMHSLGTAEGWSKAYFPHNVGWGWLVTHSHNLFGSPENEPWINYPGEMIVEHPTYIPVGQIVRFTVRVWDRNAPAPTPLPGVRVCLHKQSDILPYEIYEIGWTDANGSVTFEIDVPTEGVLKVTCFRPRQETPSVYTQYLPSRTICHVGSETSGGQEQVSELPTELFLTVSSPTSSCGKLKLFYRLPKDERLKLMLYDLSGRVTMILKDEEMKAGYYNDVLTLDQQRLRNGVYWFVLKSEKETRTEKLVFMR
ncbi:MAG: C25 family cysteine peptidase [candidate division WOR-3 bacterium]